MRATNIWSWKKGLDVRSVVYSLVLGTVVCAGPAPSLGDNSQAQKPSKLRELWGKENADAQKAAGSADRLRADFESRYSWRPSSQMKPSSEQAKQEAERIISTYDAVIKSYPNTELAAYSGLRLAGFYQYLGQTDKALNKAKEVASAYENTEYAPKAAFEVGLLCLQANNNPTAAMEWFKKVPKPPRDNLTDAKDYDENEKLYLAAQEQVAKCALTMGQRDVARDRFTRLDERYPMYRDTIKREQEAQGKTALHPDLRLADDIIEEALASLGTTTMPSAPIDQQPISPIVRSPSRAVDAPVVPSDRNGAWTYWAGGCLLLLGIALCGSGAIYGSRTKNMKGEKR